MKAIITLVCTLTFFISPFIATYAAGPLQELSRIAGEVASLNLGFDDYVLGGTLSCDQKSTAAQHAISTSLSGTCKFKDGDIYVVAAEDTDIVLGIYKQYEDIGPGQLREIVGGLMFAYGEPTMTAHDKMIYWTYGRDGKISRESYYEERDRGEVESLATIKFSSTVSIGQSAAESADGDKPSAYLMISSDPMSTLFLASLENAEK